MASPDSVPDAQTDEVEDDSWITIEIEDLEGASFRFREGEGEDSEIEVQLNIESEEQEETASWFARGYIECYVALMEEFSAYLDGTDGDEEQEGEEGEEGEEGKAEEAPEEVN